MQPNLANCLFVVLNFLRTLTKMTCEYSCYTYTVGIGAVVATSKFTHLDCVLQTGEAWFSGSVQLQYAMQSQVVYISPGTGYLAAHARDYSAICTPCMRCSSL